MHVARYKFSGADYDRLTNTGLFDDRRVELINGDIIEMNPQRDPHIVALRRLTRWMVPAVDDTHDVQIQSTLALGDSRPEPDLAIVLRSARRATKTDFIIEVADSSLAYDTSTKALLYARNDVSDYWVVNLVDREIWVYAEPGEAGYRTIHRYRAGETAQSPHAPCPVEIDLMFEDL